jgi:zinc transport system substrate-binding protein
MIKIFFLAICYSFSFIEANAKLKVIVSVKPIHSLVCSLLDGIASPEVIVDGSASVHMFSLKPSDIKKINEADLVIWVGKYLEPFLSKAISMVPESKKITIINSDDVVSYNKRPCGIWHTKCSHNHNAETHVEDGNCKESKDGHIWLDVKNAIKICNVIYSKLIEIIPDYKFKITDNKDCLIAKLELLHEKLQNTVSAINSVNKKFISYHDAFQYFEKRYGLKFDGSITSDSEISASPKEMRDTQDTILISDENTPNNIKRKFSKYIEIDPEGTTKKSGENLYFEIMNNFEKQLRTF